MVKRLHLIIGTLLDQVLPRRKFVKLKAPSFHWYAQDMVELVDISDKEAVFAATELKKFRSLAP